MLRSTVALVLFTTAPAVRTRRHGENVVEEPSEVQSNAPMVAGVFTYGAPSVSVPGLRNPRSSDGCFPGVRYWTGRLRQFGWGPWVVDNAVTITTKTLGFQHPYMMGGELDITHQKPTVWFYGCDDTVTRIPGGLVQTSLHDSYTYIDAIRRSVDDHRSVYATNMTILSTQFSYDQSEKSVAARVREYGWRLVGSGFHDGSDDGSGDAAGGPQVSHLFQHPEHLDCILTFQSSSTVDDWYYNLDTAKVDFCGLQEKVHRGFRNHLRRIVRSKTWQDNVRRHLGQCSQVFVAGHSLGGAMATLFSACVASAPTPNPAHNNTYSQISWTKETTAPLPYK